MNAIYQQKRRNGGYRDIVSRLPVRAADQAGIATWRKIMLLKESMVEAAALEWFGDQSRVARTLIPAFSQGEKEEDGGAERLLVKGGQS